MNMDMIQTYSAAAASGAAVWHLIRPIAQPSIDKAISAFPAYLAGRARDQFGAAVASGKIPPSAVRLLKKLGRASLEWANEESASVPGTNDQQAAQIVTALGHFPGVDKIVALDPDDLTHDLSIAIEALKIENMALYAKARAAEVVTVAPAAPAVLGAQSAAPPKIAV